MIGEQIANVTRLVIMSAAAILAIWGLVIPAANSWMNYMDTRSRVTTLPEEVRQANRDAVYKTVCPSYAAASTWDRWTTPYYWRISWCKDYLDRL